MNKYIFLIPAGIIVILAIISTSIISTFVGLSSLNSQNNLGSTLTTINATDLIKDSRAVINANLLALNTDKLERSDWFSTTSAPQLVTLSGLTTVGTITSGTWNGTTLTVAKGGTGSTTLSANQVLLGNGASAINVVSGLGTSGQFLTSGGAGVPPTWTSASVNQTLNYIWTGYHTFGNAGFTLATATQITLMGTSTAWNNVVSKGYVDNTSAGFVVGGFATTSLGTLVVTHNLGVVPRMIKITSYSGVVGGGTAGSRAMSVGVATSTAASQSYAALVLTGSDTVNSPANGAGSVIYLIDRKTSSDISIIGKISAITSTTFSIQFTTADANINVYGIWEVYK